MANRPTRGARITARGARHLAGAVLLAGATAAAGGDPVVIGAVEDVALLPSGVVLPARVDTGAAQSSLAARELMVRDRMAEFRLPPEYGAASLRLPVLRWARVHSNLGYERRPVVELELCLGSTRMRTRATLDDREGLRYPLLIGRNTLEGRFLVDVRLANTRPPHCPEERP